MHSTNSSSGALAVTLAAAGLMVAHVATAAAQPPTIPLPGDRAYPESIAAASDGTLYVGSFANGGVVRIHPGTAKAEMWIKPGAYGTRSTLGVLVDEPSNTLWVCSNDLSAMGVPGPGSAKGSALKGFDLKTGQGKVSAMFPGAHTFCNDMAVGPDKAVYVTNTQAPQILRLKPTSQTLEVWATNPAFAPPAHGGGLDGIAFGADGNLYVDTFTKGELFRVKWNDGTAGDVTKLQTSRPTALADALRPSNDHTFLMIEGTGSLDRVSIDGDKATVETLKDGFKGPTGVAQTQNTAWVSEGQLSYLLNPAKKGQSPDLPFKIYGVPLPPR
ncbi:MAG TPA: hypothetical protein VHO91_20410 [Rhodopila sp.]|nr:hypothetical protein [Rhodopila sp.]